jgi:type I restriction-modification system DNA methylase subunit
MPIFQKSIVDKYLDTLEKDVIEKAYDSYKEVYSAEKIKRIKKLKEEQYQGGFLKDIFGSVLGYTIDPEIGYNIELEKKNETNSKKADGAILQKEKVLGVIELKSNTTKNLESIKDQAFGYKNNHKGCKYVISSNFHKLRFYVDDATEYEEFDLYNLDKETFKKFYLYLRKEGLLDKNIPKLLKEETKFHEENISKQLYKDYSTFKNKYFENIVKNNPQYDKLLLFKKSQKFLDRILFVLFAEDKELIPTNAISRIVESWALADDLHYKPLYELFTILFEHLNVGHTYKSGYEIPAYNGGLFAPDEVLDNLKVDDEILKDDLLTLSKYDFNTDVDVNILGHIFEHSLSEIEEIEAELKGEVADTTKGKRKKDGVFYTPKYITKYIVDNTVGKLCSEKKEVLGLDIDFDVQDYQKSNGSVNAKGKKLFHILESYKEWLLSLKILDPACGSGAFLNQALTFLIEEHKNIDYLIAELTNTPLRIFDTDKAILENNIFGVDINDESVEIAKLSLWLRTAQKGRKLSNLNANIKCGNSLIDDPAFAGDKAFIWEEEFPEIFAKGGFDVVIGNPPYVRQELILPFKPHLEKKFATYQSSADLFVYFIEMSVDKLINTKGIYSIIVANKWMRANYGLPLRKWMKRKNIIELIDFGDLPVFENVAAYPCILSIDGAEKSGSFKAASLSTLDFPSLDGYIKSEAITVDQDSLDENGWSLVSNEIASLVKRLKSVGTPLKEYIQNKMFVGLKTGYNAAFIIDEETYKAFLKSDARSNELLRPYTVGRDIQKYDKPVIDKYLICIPSKWTNLQNKFENEAEAWTWFKSNFSTLAAHLELHEEKCRKRSDQGEYWWELRACEYYGEFEKSKIIYSEIATEGRFTIDSKKLYCDMTAFVIGNDSKYLLSILNSKLFTFLFKHTSSEIRGGFLRWKRQYLYPLPIPDCSDTSKIEKSVESLLALTLNLQSAMLSFLELLQSKFELDKPSTKLKKWPSLDFKGFLAELKKAKVPNLSLDQEEEWLGYFNKKKAEAYALQSEIDRVDKEIDQMVYELYGLSKNEIQIVENS